MLKFNDGWDVEVRSYVRRHGKYAGFLESFDKDSITTALLNADGHFKDEWAAKFIKNAKDSSDKRNVVTIEQGPHQTEDLASGGFKLHFTGRDADDYAFHFYVTQSLDGALHIGEITYKDNGQLMNCLYK